MKLAQTARKRKSAAARLFYGGLKPRPSEARI
jgi:hypothetical protein